MEIFTFHYDINISDFVLPVLEFFDFLNLLFQIKSLSTRMSHHNKIKIKRKYREKKK